MSLSSVRPIIAKAQGPGEVAGPALAVSVKIVNATPAAVSLLSTVVNLSDSAKEPGTPMSAPPTRRFPDSLAAGKEVIVVRVFTVPLRRRNPVTIDVSVNPDKPTVVFRGRA